MSLRTVQLVSLSCAVLAVAFALPSRVQASTAPPDSTLYTNYSIYPGSGSGPILDWIVCGSTSESEGCFASGSVGPFVAIGAMLESNPSVSGNVVTRAIYVVDSGDATVKLYVYKKTDTVSATTDTVTVSLADTITLPLTGGSSANTYMAANSKFLFIGTDLSNEPVEVRKSNLAVSELEIISGGTTYITSDEYGYVTVGQTEGFSVYGPNGELEEDGGGTEFMLGTTQALPVSLFSGDAVRPTSILGYRSKQVSTDSQSLR